MGKGEIHNHERFGNASPIEWEEHAHVGGSDAQPGFKYTYAPPMAYKSFPSLTAGYTYHALAPVGSASGATTWRVFREEKATGTIEWANGDAQWDKALNDVTGLTYV